MNETLAAVAVFNVAVSTRVGADQHAVAEALADAVTRLPFAAAAVVRPYEVARSAESAAEDALAAALHVVTFGPDAPTDSFLFLIDAFLAQGVEEWTSGEKLAAAMRAHWETELAGQPAGVVSLAVVNETTESGPSEAYEALYAHRLDWDARSTDPHGLVVPGA